MERTPELERFSRLLQLETVSRQPGSGFDPGPFLRMGELLEGFFPGVHSACMRETVAEASLLFRLEGSSPSLEPVMLTAHLDVVPADDDQGWPQPPFSGEISGGRIWGRGAIDYKSGVSAMLEALESLLSQGFSPARTLYLAFGHDEEVGGDLGAAGITNLLESRGVHLRSVLDEGGYIYSYPWLDGEVAVVGLAEKGYLTLRLTADGQQGHASVPGTVTAAGRLCRALARLEEHQMPPRLCPPVRMLLEGTARMNSDRLSGSPEDVIDSLAGFPAGNALVRTTTAITMMEGSGKENILPASPRALVNFRAVPGDSSGSIVDHVRKVVAGLGVEVDYEDTNHIHEPSSISSTETPEYRAVEDALRSLWPSLPVLPGIFPAATDSRHYYRLADNVYRFQPVRLGSRGILALHSRGESLSVEDYMASIRFYSGYISRVCGS